MRDADFPADSDAFMPAAIPTLLLVTEHGDAALAALLAGADTVAIVCAPADAASVLAHLAVDIIMVLDDVPATDRTRLEMRSGAATFVAGVPALASIPRALEFASDATVAFAA